MTTFGIDISHHNRGIDLRTVAAKNDIHFAIAKISEGQGFQDSMFATYRAQAEEAGLLFAGYHYLRGDSTPEQQVSNVFRALEGADIPIIIDIERTNRAPQPTMANARSFKRAGEALGMRVSNLLYFPEWYWNEIGRPGTSGWDLWQSSYGANTGSYHGDGSSRWRALGREVSVLQFTSAGRLKGYGGNLDINAYRGTRDELAQEGWFRDYRPSTTPETTQEDEVTKEEIQDAVRNTPIKVDLEGNEQPLQRVLRRILIHSQSADEIAQAVSRNLPSTGALTPADVEEAVRKVFRSL